MVRATCWRVLCFFFFGLEWDERKRNWKDGFEAERSLRVASRQYDVDTSIAKHLLRLMGGRHDMDLAAILESLYIT